MDVEANEQSNAIRKKSEELIDDLGLEVVADLLQSFIDDSADTFAEFRRGLEVNDLTEIRRIAHSLKGISEMYGLTKAAHLAKRLEDAAAQGLQTEIPTLIEQLEPTFWTGANQLAEHYQTTHRLSLTLPR